MRKLPRIRFGSRIAARLVGSHVLVALVVMVVALAISGLSLRRFLIQNQTQTLVSRGMAISKVVAAGYFQGYLYIGTANQLIGAFKGTLNVRLWVLNTLKNVEFWSPGAGRYHLPVGAVNDALVGRAWQGLVRNRKELTAAAAVPVIVRRQVVGALILETPAAASIRTAWSLTSLVFWGELVAVGLAVVIAYSLSQRLSWPLQRLRQTVAEMGPDSWDQPIAIRGPLEVEELANEFYQMQGRIHDQMVSLEEEKAKRDALLGHVTHDFRTPLTSIRGFLEAVRDGVAEGKQTMQAIDIALEETYRLQRLVNRLLEATRIQSGTAEKRPLQVSEWVTDTVRRLAPVAEAKPVNLDWSGFAEPGEMEIEGVWDHLVEALMNVLDNAIKWAPAQSTVTVSFQRTGDTAEIAVRDRGPGFPKELLPRVLDPFVTGDPSRGGASGLGLSIVAEVMREHGGEVEVGNHPEGGALVSLRLPLKDAAGSGRSPAEKG